MLALAADYTTPVEPLWSIDTELVGTPAVTEDVVVSYIRVHGGMQIGAWDAHSGAELWRHAAVPGAQTHGVEVSAKTVVVGDALFVPYLRDDPSSYYGWQKLVIAEALTGKPLPHDWGLIWASNRPGACSGAEGVCFTGWTDAESDADQRSFRVDVETGELSVNTEERPPAAGRSLGDGIFATDDRAPDGTEMLGYSADGVIAWQKPYQDYFGPNSSSDAGWAWGYGSSSDIVIGQGRQSDPEHDGAAAFTRDLTAFTTVGIRRDSGEMVWTLDGVYPACTAAGLSYAVVESDVDGGENGDGEAEVEVDSIVPMCRINSGSITFREADGPDQAPPIDNLDIDLIGVDGKTGEIRWTVPLGAEEGSLFARESAFFSRTPSRVLMVGTVATLVDLATGESQPAPKDGIFSCAADRVGLNPNFFESVSRAAVDYPFNAGENVFPCDAHSTAGEVSAFSRGSVRDAGIHADDGIYIVGGAAGLSGFQLEDPDADADDDTGPEQS
ncbi:hypothetical protein D6T64_06060 [Cryobacterium melibiosiphilum]|uniref:PQQ-binding-like beta-propeller repeat protein n=1 Tax=Cryobacterium melibiosiphilum TaxID=995039 RepID=A0A3A5MHM7_9MICO|nr:hypothetical protein D6T64_06060 [Cryobacterium melibiosiphilum]